MSKVGDCFLSSPISQSIKQLFSLQSYQASLKQSVVLVWYSINSTASSHPRYALAVSYTPRFSFIAVNHILHDDHSSHPSDRHWPLNASNSLNTNQQCRRARLTAPTVRERAPMHPAPRLHPHPTLPLPRAYTQTQVARHAAKRTASHPSFTMAVVRSTTRTRRRPRQMEDTTSRPNADGLVLTPVLRGSMMSFRGRGGYNFPSG